MAACATCGRYPFNTPFPWRVLPYVQPPFYCSDACRVIAARREVR